MTPPKATAPITPEDDPIRRARSWWRALTGLRKAGFSAGMVLYLGSYEYIHDFGVKHPLPAFLGVLLMVLAGGVRRE